jgi:hypothetical protein
MGALVNPKFDFPSIDSHSNHGVASSAHLGGFRETDENEKGYAN